MLEGKMIYVAAVTIGVAAVGYFGWKVTARGAYESAEYAVIELEGLFEIRAYPDLMLATTDMQFDSQGSDGSFMRLFNYISGRNDRKQKVAMTTPVFMAAGDEETRGRMGFVIPKKVSGQRIPEPTSKDVKLFIRDGGRFAVIRFAGRINKETVARYEALLRQWMSNKGLTGTGDAELAGYDPPWTPGPLRRNEILIRLK